MPQLSAQHIVEKAPLTSRRPQVGKTLKTMPESLGKTTRTSSVTLEFGSYSMGRGPTQCLCKGRLGGQDMRLGSQQAYSCRDLYMLRASLILFMSSSELARVQAPRGLAVFSVPASCSAAWFTTRRDTLPRPIIKRARSNHSWVVDYERQNDV